MNLLSDTQRNSIALYADRHGLDYYDLLRLVQSLRIEDMQTQIETNTQEKGQKYG